MPFLITGNADLNPLSVVGSRTFLNLLIVLIFLGYGRCVWLCWQHFQFYESSAYSSSSVVVNKLVPSLEVLADEDQYLSTQKRPELTA